MRVVLPQYVLAWKACRWQKVKDGNGSKWAPDEVLQGLMDRAIGHNLVDAVPSAAQRETQMVGHSEELAKIHACQRNMPQHACIKDHILMSEHGHQEHLQRHPSEGPHHVHTILVMSEE